MQNNNLKFKIFLILILGLLTANVTNGAELNFKKTLDVFSIGDVFDVALTLNTEEEVINTIEVFLKYSDNLELENISDGNSIINLWISKPKLEDSRGSIFLSGLVPGGIKTGDGTVLSFTFKSLLSGRGDIQIKDAKIFINDPDASEAGVKTANLNFEIKNNPTTVPQGQKLILDFLPPDKFEIYLSKDKNILDNAWFISFNAQDKGSGIDYYEVKESLFGVFGGWIKADSPYQLYYQSLFSIIKVRAVDNVGREREALFVPFRLYLLCGGLIILLVTFLIIKIIKNIKNKEKI